MIARIIWGVVLLLLLGFAILAWTTPVGNKDSDSDNAAAALKNCARNPQSPECL